MRPGKTQIYTGDGKGKTTAAFGLALRAAGRGMRVIVVQFLKGAEPSGEVIAAREHDLFTVERFGAAEFCVDPENNPEHGREAKKALARVGDLLAAREHDIVIADEIVTAMHIGLISESEVLEAIEKSSSETEFILTGRGATDALIDKADLVTGMRDIKHYFRDNVPAREGIEF